MRALLLFAAAVCLAAAPQDWKGMIRKDRPRLFLNADTWPAIKARALGPEQAEFASLKKRVDALAAEWKAAGTVKTRRLRQGSDESETLDYGNEAAEAAFVYLVTREAPYAEFGKYLLETSVAFYNRCFAEGRSVNWYGWTRIHAWMAYDWLFESMSAGQRKQLGAAFLKAVNDAQPTRTRRAFRRENWGGPETGYYGTPVLAWYAGLATFGTGIDDALSEDLLNRGYEGHVTLLRFRAAAAGDDGGSSSAALNYSLSGYPWADFNFFHTFRAATGRNIAADWVYPALFPGYMFWNLLPGSREFGYGDSYHTTNALRLPYVHLLQTMHFYAKARPEEASFAQWLLARGTREGRGPFPMTWFLLTDVPAVTPVSNPEARMPTARHFSNMAQVFFRSGSGPDDTYAMFTAGGTLRQHRHFDANHFSIYRKGFLAIDTGSRPEPGLHLPYYYARTVAHNAVLIRMPGEKPPTYWGERAAEEEDTPPPNDGGQRTSLGSQVVAFETRPEYAYAAGDATATYDAAKCKLAVRQFVFVPPDFFVVLDRVVSTDAAYPKTWLLHTVNEPELKGDTFAAAHEGGRLFGRTLLPAGAKSTKIGGPGKEFWADGRNWALPKRTNVNEISPLMGQWRVEVAPGAAAASDLFLHVLQAADAGASRAPSDLIQSPGRVGARFRAGSRQWEVTFATEGAVSGHVRAVEGGRTVVDRELARDVMPQSGLWGAAK